VIDEWMGALLKQVPVRFLTSKSNPGKEKEETEKYTFSTTHPPQVSVTL
jgi:hypothetical protein